MSRLEKKASLAMKDQIISFLEKINYTYKLAEGPDEQTSLELGVALKVGESSGLIIIHKMAGLVECYASVPVYVPESHRLEVSKYIDIANAISFLGHFQLNHTTGQVRSKTYFRFQEEGMHELIIQDNLTEVYYMLDKFIPGIMKIVYGNKNADDAINEIMNQVNPKNN